MSRKISLSEQQDGSALAERIRIAFGDKNLREIARDLKMSYSGLNHVMHGRRRVTADLLESVFKVTGHSIHWLVTGSGPRRATERSEEEIVIEYLLNQAQELSIRNRQTPRELLAEKKPSDYAVQKRK